MVIDANAASARYRLDAAATLCVVVLLHIAVLAMLQADPRPQPEKVPPVTVTLLVPPAPQTAVEIPLVPLDKTQRVAPKPTPAPRAPRTPASPAAMQPGAVPLQAPAPAVEVEPAPALGTSALPANPAPPAEGSAQSRASDRVEAKPPWVPARYDAAYLDNPKPDYPRLARRLGEQGTVQLSVYVSAGGRPEKIELHASSGSARLDQAARATVARWKFVPARQGDQPVAAWLIVPITFVLEG